MPKNRKNLWTHAERVWRSSYSIISIYKIFIIIFFYEILDNTEVNISQLSFSNIVVMNIHLHAFFLPLPRYYIKPPLPLPRYYKSLRRLPTFLFFFFFSLNLPLYIIHFSRWLEYQTHTSSHVLLHRGWGRVTMLRLIRYDKHRWIIWCPLHVFPRRTTPYRTTLIISPENKNKFII